jgi:hypothetical protein
MVSQAVRQILSLPTGYSHDFASDMFGQLHKIYQGDVCIGTFGQVGDRYWINSKLYSTSGTFGSPQSAADKLVQLWELDCPALAAA